MAELEQRTLAIGVPAALAAAAPVAVAAVMLTSSRTLVSWHGFVHVGIAEHLALTGLPAENPFFAGERLPYCWVHQAFAAAVARLLSVDSLYALALLTLASLALLSWSALRIGALRFGSAGAGLLIGWLALAGLNPAGPAIAAAKALRQGIPLLDFPTLPVETVFVSNESADLFMAQPLLGALHVSADWRRGQNLPWFLDNSSLGPALALLMPLLALVLAPRRSRTLLGAFALGALCAAFDPLVGLAGTGALVCGAGLVLLAVVFARMFERPSLVARVVAQPLGPLPETGFAAAMAALAGALAAAPTYLQLSAVAAAGPAALSDSPAFFAKLASIASSFCVLAPLACCGALRAPERLRPALAAIACGGLALAGAVPLVGLAEGNEHALANAAGVLLAVPALGFAAARRLSPFAATALVALFLPTTMATLASFAGRPPLPIARHGGVLVRTPGDDPLAQLYEWARASTPADAIFVVDAAHPVKMAASVSELPAFTGRALFTDHASALTAPHAEFGARRRLAARLTAGEALTAAERAVLAALRRPVYLLSHAADDEHLAARFARHHGAPLFVAGFVAVYPLELAGAGRASSLGRALPIDLTRRRPSFASRRPTA